MSTAPAKYYSSKDLEKRLRRSIRTIQRWQKWDENPFPKPSIAHAGTNNLYSSDAVHAWEERQRARTDQHREAAA